MVDGIDWSFQLAGQLDWHWREQLRPRLDGLTDAEYRWEPVPGAWNVRPRGTGTPPAGAAPAGAAPAGAAPAGAAPAGVGADEFVLEFAWPQPDPPPVTTS